VYVLILISLMNYNFKPMLISPFYKLSLDKQKRNLIFLLIFMIVMVGVMRFFDSELKNNIAPSGIVSFELAKELPQSEMILNSWNDTAKSFANLSMKFDFIFLIVYALFLGLLVHRLNESVWKQGSIYQLGILICWSILLAAIFDIIENLALMQLLKGHSQQIWSSTAYYFALIKFALLALGVLFILVSLMKLLISKVLK